MNNQFNQSPQQPLYYNGSPLLQSSPALGQPSQSLPPQGHPVLQSQARGAQNSQTSPQVDMMQRQLASQMNGFHIQTPVTEYVPAFAPVSAQQQQQQQQQQPIQYMPEHVDNNVVYQQQISQLQPQQQQQQQHIHQQGQPHNAQVPGHIPQGSLPHGLPMGGPPTLSDQQNPITPPQFQQSPRSGMSTFSPDYPVTSRNSTVGVPPSQHIRNSSLDEKLKQSRGSMSKEEAEAELTIEDILNSDPFDSSLTNDNIVSPMHNYTHNEEDEDVLISSFIDLESSTSPSMPLGLGLDFNLDPPKRQHYSASSSLSQKSKMHTSSSPNTSSVPTNITTMSPTTPIVPPQAPFSHSKTSSVDARSPKRISTSPSKSHTFNVSKKQIRKSSSFTGGVLSSPVGQGQSSSAGVAAPFQVHLSNSGTIKQQPQFSLSDCSNSFSIISNSTENFSFVMEMAPTSPSTVQTTPTMQSSASNKLRRKSLSKIQPRSIEKPGLRKTQSSYFASDLEAQPQKVLKGMNDGVVIFQLNNSRK
ncbi:hypothetical protein CLIB1423_02S01750 [[Candida] railenensis]|uniref:Uncharacterized protein n=1 Tax=[Candida] railenensis TaxID=45579 RepID=A0A9P0VVV6_9ASCO|nr:hypothetical protein CLIB1423_02S01750 [[Candida] railenensis]